MKWQERTERPLSLDLCKSPEHGQWNSAEVQLDTSNPFYYRPASAVTSVLQLGIPRGLTDDGKVWRAGVSAGVSLSRFNACFALASGKRPLRSFFLASDSTTQAHGHRHALQPRHES